MAQVLLLSANWSRQTWSAHVVVVGVCAVACNGSQAPNM